MAQLLPYSKPPDPPLPATKIIKASPRSALLVENDESLLNFLRRSLTDEGYQVHPASNSEEGLRLYRNCAPFNVVLIDYCVPQRNGVKIDHWVPQRNGIELAMAIREINPSQGMIIAAWDYRNAEEVPRPPELMHIPLLIDSSNFQLRRLLEKIEVDRAIEALTPSELLRLRRFADLRVRGLGRAARGRTGEDLLSEAQLRTFIGAGATREGRHWNKHVDFVWHLTGAMRSISSCWKRQFKELESASLPDPHRAYLISELPIHDAEGQEHSPLDDVASGHITPGGLWGTDAAADERLIEKDEEDRVLTVFKDDPEGTQVLQGLLDGLKKTEIMSKYGLDEKQYAAVVKRILKLLGRNGRTKGEQNGR
jgi:CheY-like chemotaxis protein